MSHSIRSRAEGGALAGAWLARGALHLATRWWRAAAQTARAAIGIPDYDHYVEHVRRRHPGREPMGRDAFFHERMLARYGKGRSRCC
ncbi:YbdD/YjiX family protein [Lysobacter koreensis]|uniref:YbdD/YjiX family protein n=1 Tax=Lysobacter koreensis TaxID=266122 RepID=A0ABW2YM52_9GAMM